VSIILKADLRKDAQFVRGQAKQIRNNNFALLRD